SDHSGDAKRHLHPAWEANPGVEEAAWLAADRPCRTCRCERELHLRLGDWQKRSLRPDAPKDCRRLGCPDSQTYGRTLRWHQGQNPSDKRRQRLGFRERPRLIGSRWRGLERIVSGEDQVQEEP